MSEHWKRDYLYRNRAFHVQQLNQIIPVLSELRKSNLTTSVEMLEDSLDHNLITAAACGADLRDQTDSVPNFVRDVSEYREKYPWTNSVPDIDRKVNKILSAAK